MSESRLRVRYAETDQMGVVYHGNYLPWLEVARVDLMRSLGFDYRELEQVHGRLLPVVEVNCRYKSPARYDDQIVIVAEPKLLRGAVLKFVYQVYCEEGTERRLLVEAETTHVVCDKQMKKALLPDAYADALRSQLKG